MIKVFKSNNKKENGFIVALLLQASAITLKEKFLSSPLGEDLKLP